MESAKDGQTSTALVAHATESKASLLRVRDEDVDDDEEEGEVPVTLVSGFSGAGKTFVLRHLLRHKCTDSDDISPEELRVGVVVGTNADSKLLKRKEKEIMSKDVYRATHSCPCCVEEKLSKDLAALIQQGEEDDHESPVDRVLVECGWASPRTLRNRLQEAKEQGIEDAQKFMVDSMVSVVDASKLQGLWETSDILAERPDLDGFAESNLNGPPVAGAENYAKRRVAELLVEQLECADVVVLTKMELVPSEQRDFIRALLRLLLPPNAGCLVVPVESGKEPSPHLAERVWIDSDWERTVATNTNEDDYKDSVTRARESPRAREELLWWPPAALEEVGGNGLPITGEKCGATVRVLKSDAACRAAVKACEGLEEGSWEFDMMDQRLGAEGKISDVDTEDAIVEVNFGRWDSRVGINTFVYTRRRPFHPGKLEAIIKELPPAMGLPCVALPEPDVEAPTFSVLSAITRSKGFCWLATFHTAALYWDHSGGHFSLVNIGQWWAATDGGMEGHADEFDGEFGDRRQEIVFIGVHLDIDEISKRLDSCLLDDAELRGYTKHFMQKKAKDSVPPGPLPGMPTHVPTRSPEDQDLNTRGKVRAPAAERGPGHHTPVEVVANGTKKASVQSRHDEGNTAFRAKDYNKAVKLYSQAISLCDTEISGMNPQSGFRGRRGRNTPAAQELAADVLERKAVLFSNRAECYLRTGKYQKALADCDSSLLIDDTNDKSQSRRLLALEKIEDETRKMAEEAELRRKEIEADRAREEADRLLELDRQRQREEEARTIEAEMKQQQAQAEELERRKQQQQKDVSAETLGTAKAMMADANAKLRDVARIEREAAKSLAIVERKHRELQKRETELRSREGRLKEAQRTSEHFADKLAEQEAQHNSLKAGYRNGIDRRNNELDKREKQLRNREQDLERQREMCAEKEREQKRFDRSLNEKTRAIETREAEVRRRDEQVTAREEQATAKLAKAEESLRTAELARENSKPSQGAAWRELPPSSEYPEPSKAIGHAQKTRVSRFFPAASSPNTGTVEPPQDFCCPITQELMQDPVVASDGHTYERAAIEDWLAQKTMSPMSNESMNKQLLIPNRSLKFQINGYLEPHRPSLDSHDDDRVPHAASPRQPSLDQMPSLGFESAPQNTAKKSMASSASGLISLAPGPPRPIGSSAFGPSPLSFGDSALSVGDDFSQDAFNQETFGPASTAFGGDAFRSRQDHPLGGIGGMLSWQNSSVATSDPWAAGGAISLADEHPAPAPPQPPTFDTALPQTPDRSAPTATMRLEPSPPQSGLTPLEDGLDQSPGASELDGHDPLAIYVSNINWETTAATLREAFTKRFGAVAHVNLKENKVRRGPSYAFIIFESAGSATSAVEAGHMVVDGRALKFEARRRTVASRIKSDKATREAAREVERLVGADLPSRPLVPGKAPPRSAAPVIESGGVPVAPLQKATVLIPTQGKSAHSASVPGPGLGLAGAGKTVRLFVGLGGGTTGEEQKTQLTRLFAQFGLVSDVEVGFMGCAFVTLGNEEEAKRAKLSLHATTPAISGLARKQGLCVEVATQKGYETALKKAGKPIVLASATAAERSGADSMHKMNGAAAPNGTGKKAW